MDYRQALESLQESGRVLAHDDPRSEEAIAGFRALFADFTPAGMRRAVLATYADEPWFNDTLKTVRARSELAEYLADSAVAVHDFRADIEDLVPAAIGWYVRWRMMMRFRRLKPQQETRTIGMSHIVFDTAGRVALHQDFWDSTAGLFEHVPVLGWGIARIKQRL